MEFLIQFQFVLADIDAHAKNELFGLTKDKLKGRELWENITCCSDAMEGAWYLLYDDHKKPRRQEKVKKLIRESIDSINSILVSESRICISLAVLGPLGAGKSFFLNFLLNLGLRDEHKVQNGPLPSKSTASSQTPLPVYVKYGKNVKVVLQNKDKSSAILFPEEKLGSGTLAGVHSLLEKKFQEKESLSEARCLELQGPFPVFLALTERKMASSGLNLELEVGVEFVDLPGCGANTGDESIREELNKADIVLFFDMSKSGREVTAADIAQIFFRHDEFEFTSRPKLVHVVNDRSSSPCDIDLVHKERKEHLDTAWSNFRSSSCYENERAKLPALNGEVTLEKMSKESEVVYFHTQNSRILPSLKKIITDHVQRVKMKQAIHPFLQDIHWIAKKLKMRIGQSISTEKIKSRSIPAEFQVEEAAFEILCDMNEASDLIKSFMEKSTFPLRSDLKLVHRQLYDDFMYSPETVAFLWNTLEESLDLFFSTLIDKWPSADLKEVAEVLCKARIRKFCANRSPTYMRPVLDKVRTRNPLPVAERERWANASDEEKQEQSMEFLHVFLESTLSLLQNSARKKPDRKSHFHLIEDQKQDVKYLLAVSSLDDDASRINLLKLLHKNLKIVVDFSNDSIREVNPHPSLNVQTTTSLPMEMVGVHDDNRIPLQSSFEKIIKETTEFLLKYPNKGADVIHKLETKLNFDKGLLVLRLSQNVDQRLWALALVNVLSDKDHFDVELEPSLVLDHHDAQVEELLNLARKCLFAHQKSYVTCKIVHEQSQPKNEIHVRKSIQQENCLELLVSPKMSENLDTIREEFKDPSQHLAPIFIPTIRPGPTPDLTGNYFLEEDPWSKDPLLDDRVEEEGEKVGEDMKEKSGQNSSLNLNIFLVVEPQHLKIIQSTIDDLQYPTVNNINLMYIVLPQKGRGIGVARAIIKSLAECFKFSLYWTVDDDIQFMYQFDGNDRRWLNCSLTRGLLFGQRVFQTCLTKTVKELSDEERDDLFDDLACHSPHFAKKTQRRVRALLIDSQSFAEVQKNPALLHSPFANISEDCGGDVAKEEELKAFERYFVDECRKRLFDDTINHIAGVSLGHKSTQRYDYMSKYPKADYMLSDQRYQVVLNNSFALKGRNFVTDEVIFTDDELQISDRHLRNTPYWGIRGSDRSFCRALAVSGVIGYQVIRICHSHKKLVNVFNKVRPSYLSSSSSEDDYALEDDEDVGN